MDFPASDEYDVVRTPVMSPQSSASTSSATSSSVTLQCSPFTSIAPAIQRGKLILDSVHGFMNIDKFHVQVIDTPIFQRLRELKQLGTCCYVFPGATNTRFEHSIGVSYLAGELLSHISRQQPELRVTEHLINLVKLGALCHDLGHGPFSHVFDNAFMPRARPGSPWHHEEQSLRMLDYMIENQTDIVLEDSDRRLVRALIDPKIEPPPSDAPKFIFDIVSNARNSIDVDKFDYLQRDCLNLGLKSSYDCRRLMNFARVIDDEICFHVKEAYNVYELFHTRYNLFKQIYTHRVAKAAEYMITDVLVLADPVLEISKSVDDPEEFTLLNDSIINVIERSKDKRLEEAQKILRRLRQRDLYKIAGEMLIAHDSITTFPKLTEVDITTHQETDGGIQLMPEDIIIHDLKMDYCKGANNPVDYVGFYSNDRPDDIQRLSRSSVSTLIPSRFHERMIRVYVRDPEKKRAAQKAVQNFVREYGSSIVDSPFKKPDTPERQRRPDPNSTKRTRLIM